MQQIYENNGQAVNQGTIINCYGANVCPIYEQEKKESKRQAEFAEDTKIWCNREAREILEMLMEKHSFTAPRLKRAWQNGISWDSNAGKIAINVTWLDPIFGYGAAGLMLVYFILQGGVLLISPPSDPLRGLLAFFTAMVLYVGMAWLVIHFVLVPYRVSVQVRKILYGQN